MKIISNYEHSRLIHYQEENDILHNMIKNNNEIIYAQHEELDACKNRIDELEQIIEDLKDMKLLNKKTDKLVDYKYALLIPYDGSHKDIRLWNEDHFENLNAVRSINAYVMAGEEPMVTIEKV